MLQEISLQSLPEQRQTIKRSVRKKDFSRSEDQIAVLLTTKTGSHYFDQVRFYSKQVLEIIDQKGKSKLCPAGKFLTYHMDKKQKKNKRFFIRAGQGHTIRLLAPSNRDFIGSYFGTITVISKKEGLILVNQLPIEQYLYGVVPSEMPSSYEMEALKAQAICARSYAYCQQKQPLYSQYGAQIDDTTHCQVYRPQKQQARVIQAVDQTRGRVLTYKGKQIQAYYFSTSCGATANGGDAWPQMSNCPYLKSKKQTEQSTEKSYPWYRWQVILHSDRSLDKLEQRLQQCFATNPEHIWENGNAKKKRQKLLSLGTLRSIQVVKRGAGGIVMKMKFIGTKHTIFVQNESTIRKVLSPIGETIYLNHHEKRKWQDSLPSAFFQIKEQHGKGKRMVISISGGGYGHGVGMSQNGANQMAKHRKCARQILQFYYSGVKIKSV